MGLLNAEQFRVPYGAPAIHVARPVQAGSTARVVAHYERSLASACNVVVALRGGLIDLLGLLSARMRR